MSQKTILSFFQLAEPSSPKIRSDKSDSSNSDVKKPEVSDFKDESSTNYGIKSKPKKDSDSRQSNSLVNDEAKKSSYKKPGRKNSDAEKLNSKKSGRKSSVNGDAEKSNSKKPDSKSSDNGDAEKSSSKKLGRKSSVNDDAEKSSTKKTGRKNSVTNDAEKSNTKKLDNTGNSKGNSISTKLPARRNSRVPSSPDSPKKSCVKDNELSVNGKSENPIQGCFDDSPIKQSKKRKRIQQITDSDEDSEEKEESTSQKEDEEMEVDENDDVQKDADKELNDKAKKIPVSPANKSPKQSAKRRKTSLLEKSEDKDVSSNSVNKEEAKDSAVSDSSSSEHSGAKQDNNACTSSTNQNTLNDSNGFIPKRKTARKQVRSGKQKKELHADTSKLVQIETEKTKKSSISSDKQTDDKEGPEKNCEIVEETEEISIEKSQSSETEPEEHELKKDKEKSDAKKAIHPFFAKKKDPSASVSEEKDTKKGIKCSSATGTSYDPSKAKYHPIDDACWKKGEKTPYLALAKTLEIIEETSGRLKIIEVLANYLRSVIILSPEDLLYSVYLCSNCLAPEYEGIELGVGDMLLMKAVAQATGRTVDKIKAEVAVKGDLGIVAESSRGHQRLMFAPPKLTVSSVFSKFKEIAEMSGNTVMSKKIDKIQALFVACRESEARYIIRFLSGKLRIGLAEQSVLAALARAAVLTPPNQSYPPEIIDKSTKMSADSFSKFLQEQTLILKTTYCECPNFDLVIPVLLKEGIPGLPIHCQLQPGCPLKPMLAHPTNGISEVLKRFDKNEFTCEYKYDGERAQIHRTDKGEVKIFSRNQEDNTSKYPDIISRLPKTLKESTTSFILDTEAVAWDSETKQILPFQVLSTRKKKDAVESDIVVHVCIMAFDLLYLNGESLVKKPLKERRELLHSSFVEVENEFMFVKYRDGDSAETMQEFLDDSVKGNCEGLMVKALIVDASYEIAKRSHNWLKLKKDYLNGIGDTLDLVVIGGYHGKGKRKGFYGGFLLACYDDDNEEFQSICKLGTGFGDEELEAHTKFFKDHVIDQPKSYYRYDSSLEPDVWFDSVQIWEIKCADLSISPVHKAAIGLVDPEKGISLRFPRFLRIREDKSKPEDATVASRIAELYQKQEQVQNTKNKNMKSEEDYY